MANQRCPRVLIVVALCAVASGVLPGEVSGGEPEPEQALDARLDWWREARFGLFLHWGLYSIPAGTWGDETNHAEWIRTTAQIPVEEYDRLAAKFNPSKFDAEAWCRLAADAGMRYVVLTSKHHDGFCLWDSASTGFDVMGTPFRRDILKELATACRKHGLRFCLYHSIMDWHHPDYLPRRGWERTSRPAGEADFDRYVTYLRAQVKELLTQYGDVGIVWFDGQWEHTWTHEQGQALYDLCRELQPGILVNDRVDIGRLGHSGLIAEGCAGDYGTPEQSVPAEGLHGKDWETCLTMSSFWGWNAADRDWKSPTELIRTLVDVASKNGNLLLNVGPKPDGTFPARAVERLAAIGTWMRENAGAIRGTTSSAFPPPAWGRITEKRRGPDTTVYLHVFDWPEDGRLVLRGVGNEVERAFLVADAEKRLVAERHGLDLVLVVPTQMPDPRCTVMALELKGEPLVFRAPVIEAPSDVLVDALEVVLDVPPGLIARYTTDGTDPKPGSPAFEKPIVLRAETTVKARSFCGDRPVSGVASRRFEKVAPRPAVEVTDTEGGLITSRYVGDWDTLPDLTLWAPTKTWVVDGIDLGEDREHEHVARVYEGYLDIPADDVYVFSLTSDDGSRLSLDDEVLIDLDGLHGILSKEAVVPLARGLHAIRVEWFNKTGGATLKLLAGRAGEPPTRLHATHLFHVP